MFMVFRGRENKSGKNGWMILCAGLVLALVLLPWAASAQTVKIGAVYPLSGGVAEASSWVVEGVKMAVDEINNKGGIPIQGKNQKIELVLYDSKCDPTTGVSAVEKMVNRDKVVAITGDYCSSAVLAEREVSGRAKVVQVTPIAVHPNITSPDYPYMFRIVNTINMYAKPFVEYVSAKLSIKNIALMAITDDYGRSAVNIYSDLYPKNNIKITATEWFKHGDKDFYTQLTKLVSTKPDAIYIVTDEDSQNIGILKQLKELGFKGKILGCSTYATDNMIKLGGKELLEGMYLEGVPFELNKEKPEVQEWLKGYARKFGRNGNGFSLWGYQSIQVLSDAIQRANSLTDKEKIREAMKSTQLTKVLLGYNGEPKFDAVGQVHPYLGALQYKNGKRVAVYVSTKAD
jgi:branched-chain amino acid transport system substrate-binding protein